MGILDASERDYVRELARQVAEIAESRENALVQRRWRDVNALRRPDRAPVWCRPVGAWSELLPEGSLRCADPWLRGVERELRMGLVKHEIGDDTPFDPWYPVAAAFDSEPPTSGASRSGGTSRMTRRAPGPSTRRCGPRGLRPAPVAPADVQPGQD